MKKPWEIEKEVVENDIVDEEEDELPSFNKGVSTNTLQRLNTRQMKKKEVDPNESLYPEPNIQRSFDE